MNKITKEQRRIDNQLYYKKHRKEILERGKQYRTANPNYQKKYYKKNIQYYKNWWIKYKEKNYDREILRSKINYLKTKIKKIDEGNK